MGAANSAGIAAREGAMGRRLVVCLDGTGNEIGRTISNVLKLYRVLDRGPDQIVYYDPGVGTIDRPSTWNRIKQNSYAVAGLALGVGLDQNVLDAYSFLCRTYMPGDELYLFGFSRGAYTARVLAGFIHMIGLLEPEQLNLCGYALTSYKRANEENDLSLAWQFKRNVRSRTVLMRLVGVWDTVSSVIVPRRDRLYLPDLERLPYTRRNPSVKAFRQAISIDERRRMFRLSKWVENQPYRPRPFVPSSEVPQDVRQVWFAGAHADIGGGYPETESGLPKFPLLWMIDQAVAAGLTVNRSLVNQIGWGDQRTGGTMAFSKPDARGPAHRSLRRAWWLLEPLPKLARLREWPGRWKLFGLYLPLAEPRLIPENSILHQSVLDRIAARIGYAPINLPRTYRIESHSIRHRPARKRTRLKPTGPDAVLTSVT